jgi:hypothetical protein
MSRKGIHTKGFTDIKRYDLLYNSNWNAPMDFTSPSRRPNSKSTVPTKLEEFYNPSSKMQSPNRADYNNQITETECK